MAQRYNVTNSSSGCNLYQTYPGPGAPVNYPTVPAALTELGMELGTKMLGSLNTQWMFTQMATGQASIAAGGNIYVNPASTPPFQATGTTVAGGVTGTVLVAIPAATGGPVGCWAEVTGQTLNLTPAMAPMQAEGEAADAFKKRFHRWMVRQGLHDDGKVMPMDEAAAANTALDAEINAELMAAFEAGKAKVKAAAAAAHPQAAGHAPAAPAATHPPAPHR